MAKSIGMNKCLQAGGTGGDPLVEQAVKKKAMNKQTHSQTHSQTYPVKPSQAAPVSGRRMQPCPSFAPHSPLLALSSLCVCKREGRRETANSPSITSAPPD